MKAISDLPRLRGSLARAFSVEPGAVAADNLDLRVSLDPLGGGSRRLSGSKSTTRRRSRSTMTVP